MNETMNIQHVENKDKDKECLSKHPFPPFNIINAKAFIIGSIPPHRFSEPKNILCGDIDWYYGSKDNSFWDILKESCCNHQVKLCTKKAQQDFLQKNEIGIFDMIQECTRKEGCGSSDSDLHKISLIDVYEIISGNKNDNLKLFFTSIFVAKLFSKQAKVTLDLTTREMQRIDNVCNKTIEAVILYSPSPSWSRGLKKEIREQEKNEKNKIRVEQYKQICSTDS